jgi:hypothetical protein
MQKLRRDLADAQVTCSERVDRGESLRESLMFRCGRWSRGVERFERLPTDRPVYRRPHRRWVIAGLANMRRHGFGRSGRGNSANKSAEWRRRDEAGGVDNELLEGGQVDAP